MPVQRTFSIIKPDATARNLTGSVNAVFEKAGLRIVAQKRVRLTRAQAEGFYAEHKARGFFGELGLGAKTLYKFRKLVLAPSQQFVS